MELSNYRVSCDPPPGSVPPELNIQWELHKTPCYQEYLGFEDLPQNQLENLFEGISRAWMSQMIFKSPTEKRTCNHDIQLMPQDLPGTTVAPQAKIEVNVESKREKRDAGNTAPASATTTPTTGSRVVSGAGNSSGNGTTTELPTGVKLQLANADPAAVAIVKHDGIYLLVVRLEAASEQNFSAKVDLTMKGSYGYLSAVDWPFLPFYGVLCVVYTMYAIAWLVVSAMQWRDLLRIQFWIGGVIFLGLLEKATFYAEYESINWTGRSVPGAIFFAELVSCMKRSLARLLVIVVSLGFGIVKPRLGPMLHRVVLVGVLYFVLALAEGSIREFKPKLTNDRMHFLLSMGLALLDSAICWWIFSSLVNTTRTLTVRRNVVKLTLYRHFTNTLIFSVLASVVFLVWVIFNHRMVECIRDWKEIWFDDGYWQLLFTVLLLVIMVLWRPTANNQRFAFTPLLDAEDDEEDEQFAGDAYGDVKMRGPKTSNGSSKDAKELPTLEDDLKWLDENIPSTGAEGALANFVDSDEEIVTVKFERNKME